MVIAGRLADRERTRAIMGGALEIDRLEVGYGTTRVLKGISLAIAPGEFVALLGASGCGKTTLLRAMSGFVPVLSGTVRADGRDVTQTPPDGRDMAMVFQTYALWPHMSAAQNIGYGLRVRGWARARIAERVEEMLRLVRLEGLGGRRPAELSGGQRQRVALARALAVSPRYLLLDEPLSNLDARVREDVRHEIKAIQRALGITAIHVTHDREEAMILADRIVILDRGMIAQAGAPEEVYNHPDSAFVANFMGATNALDVDAAALPRGVAPAGPGPFRVHFRGEAATLAASDAIDPEALMLDGCVVQISYPGGVWRHAVEIGARRVLVDAPVRHAPGESLRVRVPRAALHVFAITAQHETAIVAA
jgi:putative spermidine/putrescine transport system ATP-binding protein